MGASDATEPSNEWAWSSKLRKRLTGTANANTSRPCTLTERKRAGPVASRYAGGRGRLYRGEPIAIAFSDDYAPVVPLASRPAGTSAERTQLLRLQLTARPEIAIGPEPTTSRRSAVTG